MLTYFINNNFCLLFDPSHAPRRLGHILAHAVVSIESQLPKYIKDITTKSVKENGVREKSMVQ